MANLFKHYIFNNLVACSTAFAFATTIVIPIKTYALPANLDPISINFGVKVEKTFEKIKRAIDKGDTNRIVGYMFDVKSDVEQYTGNKIDIERQIDLVQSEAKSRGQKIDDRYIKQIKKDFHKQDKKRSHRLEWYAHCQELNIPYSSYEADFQFDENFIMWKSENKDVDVPIPILVGITVTLCGVFLVFVPSLFVRQQVFG